jgi:hypothetical protein
MEKTYITLEEYNSYRDRIFNDLPWNEKEWKTIDERDKMIATLGEMYKHLMPEVGMPATAIYFSDRRAKTVVEVLTPNKIVVRENCTECIDYYKSDYKILDELSNMPELTFTRRKSGRWVEMGQPDKYGSVFLVLGHRTHYIDPSF